MQAKNENPIENKLTSDESNLLEVYLDECATIEKNIDRRLAANRFNVSIITALAAVAGVIVSDKVQVPNDAQSSLLMAIAAIAFVVSVSWFFQILRFREVSRVKHEVASDLEKQLGVSRIRLEAEKFKTSSTIIEQTLSELLLPGSIVVALLWLLLSGSGSK